MSRGPGLAVIVFFLLISAFTVTAQSFDIDINGVKDTITTSEQSIFQVTITNNAKDEDTFRFQTSDVVWNIQSDPLYHYFNGVKIAPGEARTVTLLFNPAAPLAIGTTHRVELAVASRTTGETVSLPIFVKLVSDQPQVRDYLAAVQRLVEIPARIDPRDEIGVIVNLANRNPKNITNLTIKLDSTLFTKTIETTLEPLEKKSVSTTLRIDPLTQPMQDKVFITFIADGDILQPSFRENFEIIGYSNVVEQQAELDRGFLKTSETKNFWNDGNIDVVKRVEIPMSAIKSLFTKTEPEYFVVRTGEQRFIAWDLALVPQQTKSVIVTTNYSPLFYVFMVILVSVLLYYFFRPSVTISKTSSIISLNEGGISELKLIIHIKNRSNKPFERITIIDRLPNITDVEREVDLGSLRPSSVTHSKHGTVIKWEIDGLDKFEERVLSYKVHSKLSILGGFDLPAATVIFHDEKGTRYFAKSKKVRISD